MAAPVEISSTTVQEGRLILNGSSLTNVSKITPLSSNLSGYTMEIESRSNSTIKIKLTHASTGALSLAIGTVLSFSVATASSATTVNLTIEAAVPAGAIVAYNGACPSGWSEFSQGKGRMLLGAGSGNLDALGSPLTTRTPAASGGLEYTTGIPAVSANADEAAPDPLFNLGIGPGIFKEAPADTTVGGNKADSNLPPYVVVRFCQKS